MASTYSGGNLIFIVGAPRSGTTWLQRLLATHASVRTGHESKIFRFYVSPLLRTWRYEQLRENDPRTATGRGFTGMSCYLRDEEFLTVLKEFLVQMLGPMIGGLKPGEIFVEKTPSHALCLPEIRELLPESRIIHVLRDGRDVAALLLAAGRS